MDTFSILRLVLVSFHGNGNWIEATAALADLKRRSDAAAASLAETAAAQQKELIFLRRGYVAVLCIHLVPAFTLVMERPIYINALDNVKPLLNCRWLRDIYTLFNPAKLNEMESILQRYKGFEMQLFEALHKKYNFQEEAKRVATLARQSASLEKQLAHVLQETAARNSELQVCC